MIAYCLVVAAIENSSHLTFAPQLCQRRARIPDRRSQHGQPRRVGVTHQRREVSVRRRRRCRERRVGARRMQPMHAAARAQTVREPVPQIAGRERERE